MNKLTEIIMMCIVLVLLFFYQPVSALSTSEEVAVVYKTYDNLKEKNINPPEMIKEKIGDKKISYYMEVVEYRDDSLLNRTAPVTTSVSYDAVTTKPIPESYRNVVYYDRNTEKTVTGDIPLESMNAVEEPYWIRDVEIPITFNGYNSQYYQLGNLYIPYNADKPELEGQKEVLLDALNLDKTNYKINAIDWNGEAYEEADLVKRNAIALGERLVTPYKATYKGMLALPDIKKYTAIVAYKARDSAKVKKEASVSNSTMKKEGHTKENSWMDSLSKAKLIGPISTLSIFGILLFVLIIYRHQKNKKIEKLKVKL